MNNWQRRFFHLSCAGMILLASAGATLPQATVHAAAEVQPVITINGKRITWSNPPFIAAGTTYVPLREVAVHLGAQVKWSTEKRASIITYNGDTILHQSGTDQFEINGETSFKLSKPSKNVKGSLMIPLRSMNDVLKANLTTKVQHGIRTIDLTTDAETKVLPSARLFDSYLIEQSFSGIALVARNGEIQLRKGYGSAGGGKLVTPDMKSRIASITKSFTAAAIMRLEEQGLVNLEDKLSKYIPDFPRGNEITVHMLLSHTAGVKTNFTREENVSLAKTVEELKGKELDFEPGTAFKYSNGGYVLLAAIIEQVSGVPYGSYLETHFFKPLGMKNTGTATSKTPTIKGYIQQGNSWREASYYASQSGTGTLYSTVDDLLKWDQALYTEQVVNKASLDLMFTPYSEKNYGYGWMVREGQDGLIVFHNGSGTGYSTGMTRDLGTGQVIILLGNRAGMDTLGLMNELHSLSNLTK